MPCTEAYREHIMYTFHGFCKTVIRYAALNVWRDRSRRRQKEISLEYSLPPPCYPCRRETGKSYSFTFSGIIHNRKLGKCTDAAGVRPGIKFTGLYGSCKGKWRCFHMGNNNLVPYETIIRATSGESEGMEE